jgi:hypothetical protein
MKWVTVEAILPSSFPWSVHFRQQQPVLSGHRRLCNWPWALGCWLCGWVGGGCIDLCGSMVTGGEPVCNWIGNWVSCLVLAGVFNWLFSVLVLWFTLYIKWLFTRSLACFIGFVVDSHHTCTRRSLRQSEPCPYSALSWYLLNPESFVFQPWSVLLIFEFI